MGRDRNDNYPSVVLTIAWSALAIARLTWCVSGCTADAKQR
jgi:hypothetical protein